MFRIFVSATIVLCAFLCACNAGGSSDPKVIATETWITSMVSPSSGTSVGTFSAEKLDNGQTTFSGKWANGTSTGSVYDDAATGTLTLNGYQITASFKGTAKTIGSSSTSSYTCILTGTMSSGTGSGTYVNTFQNPASTDTGNWTGARSSGSGITP